MKRLIFLLLTFFILGHSFLFGDFLSLYGKKIAFYLDEKSSHFYLENPNPSKRLKNLLFYDAPPASYVSILLEGKSFRLDEVPFDKPLQVENNRISGEFRKGNTGFKISFILTNLSQNDYDSIVCVVSINNKDVRPIRAGVRFLFDTVYDEANKKVYLYTMGGEKIEYDRIFKDQLIPGFLFSGMMDAENLSFGEGLYIYPACNELRPDMVILGNWKKLDEKDFSYSVEPLAKFRYNQFSNPDGSVAVCYNEITIKTMEQIALGTVLSSSKLSLPLKLFEPVSVLPKSLETNPSSVSAVQLSGAPYGLVQAEVGLFEKMNQLLDKMDVLINGSRFSTNEKGQKSGFAEGLEEAVDRLLAARNYPPSVSRPATNTNNFISNATVAREVETNFYKPEINVAIVQTNKDTEELKKKLEENQKEYNQKLDLLKGYYENLLQQKEKEVTNIIEKPRFSQKGKNPKVQEMDKAIADLDKKIMLIETLMGFSADFGQLPPDKLEEIRKAAENLENKLK
jgi:hypothetical protein